MKKLLTGFIILLHLSITMALVQISLSKLVMSTSTMTEMNFADQKAL